MAETCVVPYSPNLGFRVMRPKRHCLTLRTYAHFGCESLLVEVVLHGTAGGIPLQFCASASPLLRG